MIFTHHGNKGRRVMEKHGPSDPGARLQSCTSTYRMNEMCSHPLLKPTFVNTDLILGVTVVNAVVCFFPTDMPPPLMNPVSQVVDGDQVRLWCSTPVPCPDLPPSITWLPPDNSRHEQTYFQQVMHCSFVSFNFPRPAC